MKTLAAYQDEFQRAVKDGDDAVLAELVDTSKENRHTLLGVYRNAYVARLIDFLETDYEKLHMLLGDEQFTTLARDFIAAHPSKTPNARWFSDGFPDFLRNSDEYADATLLSDLAELEKTLTDVFDAQDGEILKLEDLASVSPENWSGLTFEPHPATRRINLTTNADDIWRALDHEETPPALQTPGETWHIIAYRPGGMASFRQMAADEAMMWDEASKGVRFSVLCEMMSMFGGEEEAAMRAAGYLQGWISAEMLSRFKTDF